MKNYCSRHLYVLFAIMISCVLTLSSSCNIINPAEPIPAYVQVDSIKVTTEPIQGSSSSRITDAWVYVDGTLIGASEMPAILPVLYAGSHTLSIHPGILINGIASTRTYYPFYTSFDTVVNFESEKTITVQPVVSYFSSTQFSLLEDFDHTGTSLKITAGSDTTITDTLLAGGIEGRCGAVHLDAAHPLFGCTSIDSFPLPVAAPVFMELDYLSENEFTVGLITYTPTTTYANDIVTFKSSSIWKKEYVNIGTYISAATGSAMYRIYLKAVKSSSLASPSLYFDNLKVVH